MHGLRKVKREGIRPSVCAGMEASRRGSKMSQCGVGLLTMLWTLALCRKCDPPWSLRRSVEKLTCYEERPVQGALRVSCKTNNTIQCLNWRPSAGLPSMFDLHNEVAAGLPPNMLTHTCMSELHSNASSTCMNALLADAVERNLRG